MVTIVQFTPKMLNEGENVQQFIEKAKLLEIIDILKTIYIKQMPSLRIIPNMESVEISSLFELSLPTEL